MSRRLAALLTMLVLLASATARAADEIQVYTGEVAKPGEWSLQQHLNYGINAARTPPYPGGLIANRALNGTPELAYGVTDWYEVGLYVPFATQGDQFLWGGAKLRNLFVLPPSVSPNIVLGVNFELSYATPRFSQSRWNLEVRPIIGFRAGQWEFFTNPIIGAGIGGREGNAFLPANRIAYSVREDLAFGVESYSDFGSLGSFASPRNQAHQLFVVTDFRIGKMDVNFGIGHGLTPASDRWAVKTIFGFSF